MSGEEKAPIKVQFHYIKGPSYRESACHGVIGGPTPQGKIWMGFFTERNPLPRMVEFHILPPADGSTSIQFNEAATTPDLIDTKEGVVRHVEFGTYLDLDVAERLQNWLAERIAMVKGKA
jgi:hypothetical protein